MKSVAVPGPSAMKKTVANQSLTTALAAAAAIGQRSVAPIVESSSRPISCPPKDCSIDILHHLKVYGKVRMVVIGQDKLAIDDLLKRSVANKVDVEWIDQITGVAVIVNSILDKRESSVGLIAYPDMWMETKRINDQYNQVIWFTPGLWLNLMDKNITTFKHIHKRMCCAGLNGLAVYVFEENDAQMKSTAELIESCGGRVVDKLTDASLMYIRSTAEFERLGKRKRKEVVRLRLDGRELKNEKWKFLLSDFKSNYVSTTINNKILQDFEQSATRILSTATEDLSLSGIDFFLSGDLDTSTDLSSKIIEKGGSPQTQRTSGCVALIRTDDNYLEGLVEAEIIDFRRDCYICIDYRYIFDDDPAVCGKLKAYEVALPELQVFNHSISLAGYAVYLIFKHMTYIKRTDYDKMVCDLGGKMAPDRDNADLVITNVTVSNFESNQISECCFKLAYKQWEENRKSGKYVPHQHNWTCKPIQIPLSARTLLAHELKDPVVSIGDDTLLDAVLDVLCALGSVPENVSSICLSTNDPDENVGGTCIWDGKHAKDKIINTMLPNDKWTVLGYEYVVELARTLAIVPKEKYHIRPTPTPAALSNAPAVTANLLLPTTSKDNRLGSVSVSNSDMFVTFCQPIVTTDKGMIMKIQDSGAASEPNPQPDGCIGINETYMMNQFVESLLKIFSELHMRIGNIQFGRFELSQTCLSEEHSWRCERFITDSSSIDSLSPGSGLISDLRNNDYGIIMYGLFMCCTENNYGPMSFINKLVEFFKRLPVKTVSVKDDGSYCIMIGDMKGGITKAVLIEKLTDNVFRVLVYRMLLYVFRKMKRAISLFYQFNVGLDCRFQDKNKCNCAAFTMIRSQLSWPEVRTDPIHNTKLIEVMNYPVVVRLVCTTPPSFQVKSNFSDTINSYSADDLGPAILQCLMQYDQHVLLSSYQPMTECKDCLNHKSHVKGDILFDELCSNCVLNKGTSLLCESVIDRTSST